jgi:hypothetical protein
VDDVDRSFSIQKGFGVGCITINKLPLEFAKKNVKEGRRRGVG